MDVFESSAATAMTRCTTSESQTTDCALSWSLEKHRDTPATLEATIDNNGSPAVSGTGSSGLLSSTASRRRITITSTDWVDVGTYYFTVKCWYTNYPDTGALTTTVTAVVADCHSSAASCACAWLQFRTDGVNW